MTMDENNIQEFEQVLDKTEAEKQLKKSKIKLIIKGVCLVFAIIGTICLTFVMKNPHGNTTLLGVLSMGSIIGLGATLLSNAVIGVLKQYGKFFVRLGQIIPFFGWIIALGLIPVFLYCPVILCIKPLKDELAKYKELKLLAE